MISTGNFWAFGYRNRFRVKGLSLKEQDCQSKEQDRCERESSLFEGAKSEFQRESLIGSLKTLHA